MPEDTENWTLLQTLFDLAQMAPPDNQERVLAEHCADPEIRRRVLVMVQGAGEFDEPVNASPNLPFAGRIGPYTLIRLLGAGGIGSVYLAERILGGIPQRVALKVLSPHAAGPSFVERFHREQHILASLDHKNILRLLDAGMSGEGYPYLVMDYVQGLHLDEYCDSRQLTIRERIEPFLQICDAVAYAHRNLIVHLDLKPSNVLVNEEGIVKLLDFGTSKLIQPDSLLTTTVLATPAYASPEQLRNEPVTTSCDIYSLGAILVDLLAGRPPARQSSSVMFERAMNETEPAPLYDTVTAKAAEVRGVPENKLRQLLSGDLATITAKCLRPRPRDRYASVDALSDDLRRYLTGRSVLARPQTTAYRIGKFVRRNRGSVAVTALIMLALVGSLSYAAWRQHQALEEGRRAVRMQTFLYRLFYLANANYTGKPTVSVPEFLELGVKLLPEYIKDPGDLRAAQMSLAESMFENGDLGNAQKVFTQIIASAKGAADFESEAEATSGGIAYMQGDAKLGQTLTAHALELSRRSGISPSVRVWSAVYYAINRDEMGFRSDENLRLLQFAAKESRDHNLPNHEMADVLYNLGTDLEWRGRLDEAEPIFDHALQLYLKDPLAVCDQSAVYSKLASLQEARGFVHESLPLYQRAYDGYKTCSGPESLGALELQAHIAGALIKLGRAREAVPMLEKTLPAWRKIVGSGPQLSDPLCLLSQGYVEVGRYPEAERAAKEAVDIQGGRIAPADRRFGTSHLLWARALVGQGRYQEALPHAEIADSLLARNAISIDAKQAAAEAHQVLLDVQVKLASKSTDADIPSPKNN
ncbi:MAG TPA: serine/threonine-protein kinase [Acidobacteriaceae bacterium]|jgi:serine/threonine protein kinase/tetratricopeptide (TPR) repeat protein|nr:serine/threonine-protein kinase [Acidobacteriaceae bacterium]